MSAIRCSREATRVKRAPIVDSLVLGRSLDVGDTERTLDGPLDFCFDYVVAYHQLWDYDGEQPP
jgi:hypothetical protein